MPSNRDGYVNLWDFKQKKNLVIIFHHGTSCNACRNKLRKLARIYKALQGLEAEVLAVSFDNLKRAKEQAENDALPFPLLSDLSRETTERYTYVDEAGNAPFPSIFTTDKFGALRYQKTTEEAENLPSEEEILSWLLLIQTECPECSHL